MWYIAYLLFAEEKADNDEGFSCETCNVLFQAESAVIAYRKAEIWGSEHEKVVSFKFVGVEHIQSLDDTRPDDGTELAGSFTSITNVWKRKDELIPDINDIPIVGLEGDKANIPIGELLTEEQISHFKKVWK